MIMVTTALLLAAAQPAAEPCELNGIPAIDVIALKVAMLDQVTNATPRPATADATIKAIEAKAAACQPGDDPAADKAAASVAIARIAAEAIGEKLAADGVDMAKVDATINETEPAVLDALIAKRFDAPGVDAFAERVIATAGPDASAPVRKLLGGYAINAARVARAAKPAAAG